MLPPYPVQTRILKGRVQQGHCPWPKVWHGGDTRLAGRKERCRWKPSPCAHLPLHLKPVQPASAFFSCTKSQSTFHTHIHGVFEATLRYEWEFTSFPLNEEAVKTHSEPQDHRGQCWNRNINFPWIITNSDFGFESQDITFLPETNFVLTFHWKSEEDLVIECFRKISKMTISWLYSLAMR